MITSKRRDFPQLTVEDLQDAYSQVVEEILRAGTQFDTDSHLAAYVRKAVANRALDITRSGAYQTVPLEPGHDSTDLGDDQVDPDRHVLAGQARVLLREFLVELSDNDRLIGYLLLDPDHEWTPRQIAAHLKLPKEEIEGSIKRTRISFGRFTAQAVRPGAVCNRRRRDVLAWQQTGAIPLTLRIHLTHCHGCRAQHHDARTAVRSAMLPLIPATGVPVAGLGGLSRLYHAAGTHPATARVNESLDRWRKFAPVGGGGGTAIAVKLAATGAVITATAALSVVATHTATHHQRPHHRVARAAEITTTAATTAAPVAPTLETLTAPTTVTKSTTSTTPTTTSSTTTVSPPPPNANPAPATNESTAERSAGTTAVSAPPPNANPAPASSTRHTSGTTATEATLPAPGGAPPP